MQVDVKHRLSGLRVAVEHGPVARTIEAALLRDRRRRPHHRADQVIVSVRDRSFSVATCCFGTTSTCIGACGLMSLKAISAIVFVDLRRGNLARDDLAEQTAHGQFDRSYRSMIATRGMFCRSLLIAGEAQRRDNSSPDRRPRPPVRGRSRSASCRRARDSAVPRSTICRMSRKPSSPATSAERRFVFAHFRRQALVLGLGHVGRIRQDEIEHARSSRSDTPIRGTRCDPTRRSVRHSHARRAARPLKYRWRPLRRTAARRRRVTARQPLPVPMSATRRGRAGASAGSRARNSSMISSVSGRGISTARCDDGSRGSRIPARRGCRRPARGGRGARSAHRSAR